MRAESTQEQETLRQIVRGERPLRDLQILGMTWHREGSRCHVDNPRGISAIADVHDLAHGLKTYLPSPEQLREWALFVNAADVDLEVDNHPDGETVLNALWDASFANSIDPKVEELIQRLAQREGAKK
jgi:hypothetical protein